MNLSLKQKAATITIVAIVSATLAGLAMSYIIKNIDPATIGNIVLAALIGWFVYIFYAITLSQLEYKQKLKEIVDKK